MTTLDPVTRARAYRFIAVQTLVWYVMIVVAKPYLDKYGDMVEVYAWSQHLLMGSNKHPQFLPWMAHFWFLAFPRTVASFYALAAINLGAGFLGIYALGRQVLATRTQALAAVALSALAFPYLTLPDKLNMNAICLSTWPWVSWAFFVAVKHPTARGRILAGIGFGLLAAIAMMSKYYSALLLASILIASVVPGMVGNWRRPAPWLGLAAFALAILPHLLWQRAHGFETVVYVDEQGTGLDLYHFLSFGLAPVYYWLIPWIAVLAMFYRGPVWRRFARSLRMQGAGDALWYLAVMPYALSMVAGLIGFVYLSEPWAIPIGYAFTLLWIRNADLEPEAVLAKCTRLLGAFRWIWPLMVVLAVVFAIFAAFTAPEEAYYPERAATAAIDAQWQTLAPGVPLAWAASGNDAARIAYFSRLPQLVEALPDLPDTLPDYYPPRPNWQAEGGVVICPLGNGSDTTQQTVCTKKVEDWARNDGFTLVPYRFSVERSGLYFPLKRPYAFAAFFHLPKVTQ